MKIQNVQIDAVDFASQGNAILGIRDSGKSYTATWLAEQLLDAGIPFVAFDPIGVWRNLQFGKNGHAGYPVVVAGDGGDLPLTAETAANIVRAAMQENIPLVLDLYSMSLTKAQWKQIVEQSVRLLLYENKRYGVRHIFIEEAAEFVPQRVGADQGRVYAEIEKLARMGRNASLGYTLINQRAEEVNKAVLELCDCLFLHRQKGRHSLTALGKWLQVADTDNVKEVINSLPTLGQGECWVWQAGSSSPQKVLVPEKHTVHPDPKNPERVVSGISVDVSKFVERMTDSLRKQEKKKEEKPEVSKISAPVLTIGNEITKLETENTHLREKIEQLETELHNERLRAESAEGKLKIVREMLEPQYKQMQSIFTESSPIEHSNGNHGDWDVWMGKLVGGQKNMLQVLIERKRVSKAQLSFFTGLKAGKGSAFEKYITRLVKLGLAKREGGDVVLQHTN
jgi:hypothetical protein